MKRVYFIMIVIVVTVISMDWCYYDKGSELGRTCDTTAVTYSNQVSSIIDLNCIECHGAGGTANPKLDTYDQVNIQVQNGSFLGTIKHEAGYSPMPQNRPQLDPCLTGQIEIWISEGAQNN